MKSNIHIIVGHYGSGKTEFAVNYAIRRRESGSEVAIADLDIVNPYFRTRQQADMLEEMGIRVVSSNLGNDWRLDIPALNSDLWGRLLELCEYHTVHLHWVKGHAQNQYNNRCDELAVAESRKYQ